MSAGGGSPADAGRREPRAGLTLIEVMLALTILAIGLFVLVATGSRCLAVARKARHYETARHLVGRMDLERPLQVEDEVEEGTDSGRFDGAYRDYRWERTVEAVGDEEDGLFQVTKRVIWSDRGDEVFEEVVTYLYAPETPGGGSYERAGDE